MFGDVLAALRRMGPRQVLSSPNFVVTSISLKPDFRHGQALLQALNFANVIASGLMMWKGLGLICNTESPIVVVLRWVVPSLLRGIKP